MIKTIARVNYPDIFKDVIDFENEVHSSTQLDVFDGHVYCTKVYEITSSKFPEYSQLWGFWKTDYFVLDVNFSFDKNVITELMRVIKKGQFTQEDYFIAA